MTREPKPQVRSQRPTTKRGVLVWFIKLAGAGLVALLLLNVFSFFYYNPAEYIPSKTGATDYVRTPNTFTTRMTEGFSFAHTDINGFNNAYASSANGVNMLIMGASHTEAYNVAPKESYTYLLNERMNTGGEAWYAYNVAMSNHNFLRNAKNLPAAVSEYMPSDYVVIETNSLNFFPAAMDMVVAGEMDSLKTYGSRLLRAAQKLPYVKLLYYQFKNALDGDDDAGGNNNASRELSEESYYAALVRLLTHMNAALNESGAKLIVLFKPGVSLTANGAQPNVRDAVTNTFKSACEATGVIFVDMTADFMSEYEANAAMTHGFINTLPGKGHLNALGHSIIADRLFSVIGGEAGA